MTIRAAGFALGLCLAASGAVAQGSLRSDLEAVGACAPDVFALCHDVLPGEGRIRACIRENVAKLSNACVDAMIAAAVGPDKTPLPAPADPQEMTFEDLRAVQYCEVWTLRGSAETGFFGDYFNTSALNNAKDPKVTCPADLWEKVTVAGLKDEFAVFWAFKNGPRGWTMDELTLPVGPVVDFSGVEARWFGAGVLPSVAALAAVRNGLKPYVEIQSHRKSTFTFKTGKPVFVLEDPSGVPWVMQAWSEIVDPKLSYDRLGDLGAKLKLPEGWKFRVATPSQDLVVSTPQGYNWIVQDDLGNTYDACKEGACNIQP